MAAYIVRGRTGELLRTFVKLPATRVAVVTRSTTWHPQSAVVLAAPSSRHIFGFGGKKKESGNKEAASAATTDLVLTESNAVDAREQFIPITRRSIIRHLMQEKKFLTEAELNNFETFSLALDSAIVNKYHGLLQELKALFDPINPDKDTVATRQWNRRERLDNEFWLIQKLGNVMLKANFRELSKATIEDAMAPKQAREGVMVSVNTDKYDVLKFWALGLEKPELSISLSQKIINKLLFRPTPKPTEYYKRVVCAVRLKRDDKLLLKAFKEVPINGLSKLLPDGNVKMSRVDYGIFVTTGIIAITGVLAKIVTVLASLDINWTLIMTGVTTLFGLQAWTMYKRRHLNYVNDLTRMLYFKNIANNRGLLTLLVDRAEDEMFKEALLAYTFLLTNRAPSTANKDTITDEDLGVISAEQLNIRVEEWVRQKTGHSVVFECAEAAKLLQDLGLLSEDLNLNLHVIPLEAAIRNLPQTPQSITTRVEEYDIVEGYDRDIMDEKEEEYKEEEKKRKKYGWF